MIFAGAGLSMNAGLPSWTDLIINILEEIKEKEPKSDGYKDAIKGDIMTPLDVLNKIEHHKEFAIEALSKNIRSYDNRKPTKIHEKLGDISTKIITTNYDCLLESQFKEHEVISYSNKYKVAKLSENNKYIFKIHGDIHEPDKCILFPYQYEELYNKNEQSSVFELKKIISDKSILFIGFSLSDPHINFVFDFIANIYNGFTPEHFIITTEKDKTWPNKINPIHINSHSDTEILLDQINKEILVKSKKNDDFQKKINTETENIIEVSESLEYDLPPNNKFWVGRKKEIENISTDIFKVIFITGIGGQGKSALAAHYIKNCFDSNSFEFADWRDFKEETNRFQTKLISTIKRISENNVTAKQLDNVSNIELVDIFFQNLANKKIVFVFDNIDSYIDLETFKPSGGIKYFFEQALEVNHSSKFIFTCRPFIREAGPNFYQLTLNGLSIEESKEIFSLYNIPIKKYLLDELSQKAYKLTNGHPLWLNLIAAQAVRGIDTVNKFIQSIEDKTDFNEDGFSSILSEKILNEVWYSLNEKQRILIRGIAETVKPETVTNLKKVIETELKNNQFDRAIKVLKNLNLIVIKSSTISEDQIELHPLVKEFILSKFPQTERAKYITLFVQYYDKFIYILKPNLNSEMNLSAFQNWTSKIELQINKGDFKSALVALEEVSSSILSAGFAEEYLRVSEKLFHTIDWEKAIENEYSYFDSQLSTLTTILTQFGKYSTSEELLEHYAKLIPGKGSQYLSYCSEKCYLLWFQEKFEDAIEIGEYGEFLITESGIADNYSLKHNLALARRDSKEEVNIKKALNYFLKGENIENILNNVNEDLSGNFYGNIGKCLELMNDKINALTCYYISINILFKEETSHSKLNIGYASSWIFNILKSTEEKLRSLYFLKLSINTWLHSSPPRANNMKKAFDKLTIDKQTKTEINKIPDWKIINHCKEIAKTGANNGNRCTTP
ncbi:SIR2 family protein [Olleya sp. HaHaR_3_96]|uniref:SIR2 family protein n=1 Tax=Olleya sp. HaHaR_3_96 TaxID=2745560 RepID=UPI001C4F91E6|nr:SIR2 family protein [Olleya sp. HaHaR_3_96]QXP58567.1 SIR2 family protein [Olleya sp. HaHaR_3_96]